jgi:outer membrane protein assembly factor BamE (lipoprotein component of BamABCDE complex)
MRRRFSSGASVLGIAAVVLIVTSCSTPQTRISDHPDLYQSLSPRDQALVSQGQIRSGMSRSAVWLAWGSSDQKIVGNKAGRPTATWMYIY